MQKIGDENLLLYILYHLKICEEEIPTFSETEALRSGYRSGTYLTVYHSNFLKKRNWN